MVMAVELGEVKIGGVEIRGNGVGILEKIRSRVYEVIPPFGKMNSNYYPGVEHSDTVKGYPAVYVIPQKGGGVHDIPAYLDTSLSGRLELKMPHITEETLKALQNFDKGRKPQIILDPNDESILRDIRLVDTLEPGKVFKVVEGNHDIVESERFLVGCEYAAQRGVEVSILTGPLKN